MNLNSKASIWTGRVITILIVAFMIFDGLIPFVAHDFATAGMAEMGIPTSYAYPLGAVTLLCTVIYAVPRTSVLGAVLFTGFFGGTIATHLLGKDPLLPHIVMALVLGALVWAGVWLRNPRLRALMPLVQP
jgi:hypothetical protein